MINNTLASSGSFPASYMSNMNPPPQSDLEGEQPYPQEMRELFARFSDISDPSPAMREIQSTVEMIKNLAEGMHELKRDIKVLENSYLALSANIEQQNEALDKFLEPSAELRPIMANQARQEQLTAEENSGISQFFSLSRCDIL